jgi:MFS family permease
MTQAFPHYRRNFAALLGDYVFFGLGVTFAGVTTVLPSFIGLLTDSKVLIGLLVTLGNGGFMVTQLFFANLVTNKPRKKPYFNIGGSFSRPLYLLYGVALWLGLARSPALALVLIFVVQIAFWVGDSLCTVAWFDVLTKSMPPDRRGRLLGSAQVTGAVLAVGAGVIIAALLGESGPSFPYNYAAVFILASVFLLMALGSWSFVVEPIEPGQAGERTRWRDYLPHLVETLRQDHLFRRLIIVRLLAGFDTLAAGFYILFATGPLGLPPETVGVFTAAQTIGGVVASLALGAINERLGTHRVIQVATALALTAPLVALGVLWLPIHGTLLVTTVYAWVFFMMGAVASSTMLGFFNYVMELAPATQRPTYIGLFNTVGGAMVVLPTIGGWLLQVTSYGALFALTAVTLAAALGLSWTLPTARRPAPVPEGQTAHNPGN